MQTTAFTRKYCQQVEGLYALKDNPTGKDCIFLKDKKCSVYKGRPVQCRTWPFWPEVMTAKAWKKEVVAFCPGIGKGPIKKPEVIYNELRDQIQSEQNLLKDLK